MNKIYDKIIWHNNTTPALSEDNLNAMSEAIDGIDNRVVDLAGTIMEDVPQIQAYLEQADDLVEALELMTANPPYIGANGNWYVWSTDEQEYVDSGIDASITVQVADVTMLAEGASPYVTNTGTATDPIFHLFIPIGATGADGVSPTVTVTAITGGHRVNITDASHPSGQDFDVMDGQDGASDWSEITNKPNFATVATSGSYNDLLNKPTIPQGDMLSNVYDSQGTVATAGGIVAYVEDAIDDAITSALTASY